MAYDGTYQRSTSLCFSSSYLDDVPFKIGPKFKPPEKILLPPELQQLRPAASRALQAEYTFELEEGVLKWTEDRERQLQEQRQAEQERQAARLQRAQESPTGSSDSSDNTPDVAANGAQPAVAPGMPGTGGTGSRPPLRPPPALPPRPVYANVTIPNPLIANISNDILTPTPINQAKPGAVTESQKNGFDVTLFDKEDDPFDNLELQTINDLEELKTVLEGTGMSPPPQDSPTGPAGSSDSPSVSMAAVSAPGTGSTDTDQLLTNGFQSTLEEDGGSDTDYENVPFNKDVFSVPVKPRVESDSVPSLPSATQFPPVPPRRDLVGRNRPLPPIGRQSLDISDTKTSENTDMCQVSQSLNFEPQQQKQPVPDYDNVQSIPNPTKKPPRVNKYSRHVDQEEPAYVNIQKTDSDSLQPHANMTVMFRNANSNPELTSPTPEESSARPRPIPAPRRARSPPSRPSSAQTWNKYSPLPSPRNMDTQSPQPDSRSCSASQSEQDPYMNLSVEARSSVDNLVSMGFSRPRVTRAVERLGADEKEVVEHLCLVEQLAEKGHDVTQAESALILFHNNTKKATEYLSLYKQFQELGFTGEKIKDALVETGNDRDKALDILTASS